MAVRIKIFRQKKSSFAKIIEGLATALQSKRRNYNERHKQFSTEPAHWVFKMEMPVPHCICTKISETGSVGENKSGYKANIAKVMRAKRGRNYRSTGMRGSYPYAGEHSAQFKCSTIHGVPQREKQSDDFRPTRQFKIQIWESSLLVQRVLRRHSWAE